MLVINFKFVDLKIDVKIDVIIDVHTFQGTALKK